MPNSINIPTPPALTGTPDNKMQQLHTYLFRLAEQMALILNSIEAGGSVTAGTAAAQSSSADIHGLREQLRQLVVNTTATLRSEIEAITLPALGIRRGMVACTKALAGGAYEDITVSFDALPSAPVVVAGLIGTGDDGEYGGNVSCRVITGSITNSGFKVRVSSSTGQTTARYYSVAWIAAV